MERHPEKISEGVIRKNGKTTPWNAGDAVAAVVEACERKGIPVAPSVKARLGKAAKGLLDSGFNPDTVVTSGVLAVETGMFGSVETIAQELVVAAAGHRLSRNEYRRALGEVNALLAHSESVVWQTMRAEMARREELPREAG